MRIPCLVALSAVAVTCVPAFGGNPFTRASMTEAARSAFALPSQSNVAMWTWTDKYLYKPGDPITLKWTIKTYGDPTPYTVFIYRQNNETGRKVYLPKLQETATDINGNTEADGYEPMQLSNVDKGVIAGADGIVTLMPAPAQLGMHTFVVELRDFTGRQVLKASYMKVGVISDQVDVTGTISTDTTLTNDKSYMLRGVVTVKGGATLTIQPGTIIMGAPGSQPPSVLLVTREGKLNAVGTPNRPIIFTSSLPFGQRARGDWGGVLLLGKAKINVGANATPGQGANNAGEFYIEGLRATPDGLYGGNDDTHSCGSLRYVRIEYAGSILSPNNETNAFTFGGCGTGTVADHLQAIYGADDSFEWFGGSMSAKYLVGGLAADDYVDFQLGFRGKVQYGVFYQSPDAKGNRGIEGDNSEYNELAEPFSDPTMYNLTFFGSGVPGYDESNSPGIFLRRGARGTYNDIVVSNFNSAAVLLNDANTRTQMQNGLIKMNGILAWNNNLGSGAVNTPEGQVTESNTLQFLQGTAGQGNGKNYMVSNPFFTRPFEYSDPDFRSAPSSPIFRAGWVSPPDDGFFDQSAKFIGGIGDTNWMLEWTSFLVESDID